MTPALASSALKVVAIETESKTASTATLRFLDAREDLLLDKRDAEFGVGAQQLRINLVERLRRGPGFWRREVIDAPGSRSADG